VLQDQDCNLPDYTTKKSEQRETIMYTFPI